MNCAAVTGSICLRSVATVSRCILASNRRSHHSCSCERGRPRPRGSVGELSSQYGAGRFHSQHRLFYLRSGKSKQLAKLRQPSPDPGATSIR